MNLLRARAPSSAAAGQDVPGRCGDHDDRRGYGHNGDCRRSDDHPPYLPPRGPKKPCAAGQSGYITAVKASRTLVLAQSRDAGHRATRHPRRGFDAQLRSRSDWYSTMHAFAGLFVVVLTTCEWS